jgi:hypothetical protein
MVIVYNPIGMLMCFLPAVLASIAWVYLPRGTEDIWTLVGAWGAVAFTWDTLYRVFNRDEHWLSPRRGGHIFFIPVCLLASGALWWYVNQALERGYWLPHATPSPNSLFQ